MRIVILGAAGFIGTNLALKLCEKKTNKLMLYDESLSWLSRVLVEKENISCCIYQYDQNFVFDDILQENDVVLHLASTNINIPATSNMHIPQELQGNIITTSYLLESCVRKKVKKIVFISSGGTVYGKDAPNPIIEDTPAKPITSYGLQKLTIEKLLYLYKYMYGMDYCVVRLANPYGPYQRPNGVLGVITTFTYKALCHEKVTLYGDGSIVRDYIYIDDAINAIVNLTQNDCIYDTYNVASGIGTSINELVLIIEKLLGYKLEVEKVSGRKNDLPKNILCVDRYENEFGKINQVTLVEGIRKTIEYLKVNM